jgi:hypothetical protein
MMGNSIAPMIARLRPLPPRHRIAHLRALIRLQPRDSDRREQLAELLLTEVSGASGE